MAVAKATSRRRKTKIRAAKPVDSGAASQEQPSADGNDDAAAWPPLPKKSKTDGNVKGGWRALQMDVDLMQEFEAEGGVFIEEADDDVCLTYSDGRKEVVAVASQQQPKRREKAKRTKRAVRSRKAEDCSPERAPNDLGEANHERGKKRQAAGDQPIKAKTQDVDASAGAGDDGVAAWVEATCGDDKEVPELPEWFRFDLHPALLRGLGRLGFVRPTEVQARCLIPAIHKRKDIVGAAETGSGKTLAFGLPILHHTLTSLGADATEDPAWTSQAGPRGLIILPTRELAVQVQGHINDAAQCTRLRAECVVGGISVQKQMRLLKRKPHIVVGTPGRLFALLGLGQNPDQERCDWFRSGLKDLRHLVLDEADRLVESGHFKELDSILGLVYSSIGRLQQLQTFVFSATLTLDPRSSWQRRRQGDDEQGGKVGALMRRMQFREARAVHTVDLTQPEVAAASSASVVAAAAAAKAAAGARGDGDANSVRKGLLPETLSLHEAVCSDDKDKEAVLAMWLLRRYRWNAAAGGTAASAAHAVATSESKHDIEAAKASLGGRIVLFVNAISSVLRLTSVLSLLMESPSAGKVLSRVRMARGKADMTPGLTVEVLGLHSQMKQRDRLKRMERFRGLQHAVLVCTDIAARGLDVRDLKAVLHYQPPRSAEIFVHRSGRTARAGRTGDSVAFVGPSDSGQWQKVYRAVDIGRDRVSNVIVDSNHLNAAREAIRLAVDLEARVHKLHKQSGDRSWLRRTAEEAELALSDDDLDPDQGRDAAPRRQLWGLYQQLQARVRRPPRRAGAGPIKRGPRPFRR